MAAASNRNNILAGSFLLLSVALGIVASFVLSDFKERLRSTKEYVVRFSMAQGAAGIKPGSPVLLGGQPAGKVSEARIVPDIPAPADRPQNQSAVIPGGIDVTIRVDAQYTLYDNALIYLEKPLLGSLTSINIASMGIRELVRPDQQIGASPELMEREQIRGAIAPPSFLSDAGLGANEVLDIRQMIAQAKDAVGKINTLIDNNAELISATLTDVRSAAGDARGAVKTVSDKMPEWATHVDNVLVSADDTAKGLPTIRDRARSLLDDGRQLVADTRAIVTDNRPKIDSIIDNVDHASGTIRESIDPLASQAKDAMASFGNLSTRLDTIVADEGPNIRRTLANARLASDQLKLAMLEIRAQPWRLLVQPDTKELQQQLLYDSARSYASAVSDLRSASESLESMVGPGMHPSPMDAGRIAERMKELDEAFEKYREAEKKLFEQMQRSEH